MYLDVYITEFTLAKAITAWFTYIVSYYAYKMWLFLSLSSTIVSLFPLKEYCQ